MLVRSLAFALVTATFATGGASATDANKACADGLRTFQKLFINDSGLANNSMQWLRQTLPLPADMTFTDVVEAIKALGAERVVNEATGRS